MQRLKELYQKFSSAAAQSRTTQKCWTYLATRSVLDQFHFSLFWLRQVLQFTCLPGASGLGAKSVLAHFPNDNADVDYSGSACGGDEQVMRQVFYVFSMLGFRTG